VTVAWLGEVMQRSKKLGPLKDYLPREAAKAKRQMTQADFDRVMRHWGAALNGAAEGEARRRGKAAPDHKPPK
jgi:hypothetical protein